MYVKTYQPHDVFRFWREIQRGCPSFYDFKYVTNMKRGMLQFMIYVHRGKQYTKENVDDTYEHFIEKREKITSFHVILNDRGEIESQLYENEFTGKINEMITCEYSLIRVPQSSDELIEKIKHRTEEELYDYTMKKLKVQRLKELFDEEE